MTKLVIGIFLLCGGITLMTVGGYLAKDGWEEFKKQKNKFSHTPYFNTLSQAELAIEIDITPQKILNLFNKCAITIKDINIFATKYFLDENAFNEKQIKIKDFNKSGGTLNNITLLESHTGSAKVDLNQFPFLHFFENPGNNEDNTPLLTYYCFRITFRSETTGKKDVIYKVTSSYRNYPSFIENQERTATSGSWGDFLLEIPNTIIDHQKKLFNDNL